MIEPKNPSLSWTDVHTHLNMLKIPAQKAVDLAEEVGVRHMITIGTEPQDWPQVISFSQNFIQVKGALGMHPHSADLYTDEIEDLLRAQLDSKEIIACGEIGLDYYYENSKREKQKQAFYRQMLLAKEKKLPVEIHTRCAEDDTIAILKEFKGHVRGLLHCFSGTWDLAKSALDLGFNISFSGIVTFKNAEDLRKVCCKTPLDRMHLETDAPYLAPTPHRGKENAPALLVHTAQLIAQIRSISEQELSLQTEKNYKDLFPSR